MRRSAAFAAVAFLFGLAYALITPPFEVPDEVGHYWRASSIAYGFLTAERPLLPRGFGVFVWACLLPDRTQHMTAERLHRARGVLLEPQVRGPVRAYAFYSPAAYVPQIAAAFIARVARMRPFYGFYLGRIASLLMSILVIVAASEIAPDLRDHIHAAALLPMSLFLFASWSADAMTIASAFLTTSLIVSGRAKGIAPATFWLALCKPSYALLSLVAPLFVPKKRWLVLLAIVAGSFLSVWLAMSTSVASPRPGLPIDSHAQVQFIFDDPARFVNILIHNLDFDDLRSMAARFGLYDVAPPAAVTTILLLMLVAVGVMNGPSLSLRVRLAICGIAAAIFVAILTYLYVTSSIAGGITIEGTQGRYILPLLPLTLCVLRVPRLRFSVPYAAIVGISVAANAVCIAVLVRRYW